MIRGSVDVAEMRRHVQKPAAFELSLDFDKHVADLAKERCRYRNVVDACRGFAVAFQPPPQDQLVVAGDVGFAEPRPGRMVGGGMEDGADLRRVFALADQPEVGTAAERQPERVKKDGFPGAGLARQNGQATVEAQRQPFDQDDIGDRQTVQHRYLSNRSETDSMARWNIPLGSARSGSSARASSSPVQ